MVNLKNYLNPDPEYVFHGSSFYKEKLVPSKHGRRNKDGKVIFDDISVHATPYKWIALAYTYFPKKNSFEGKEICNSMGVSLYNYEVSLDIYGFNSLEKSLENLYGGIGYIYHLDKKDFFHTEGLGDLELISQKEITPIKIEKIDRSIDLIKRLGIKFNFIDLSNPENQYWKQKFPKTQPNP